LAFDFGLHTVPGYLSYTPPTPKPQGATNDEEKKEKESDVPLAPTYLLFFEIFFEMLGSGFRKCFYGVFRPLMQRSGQKRDKKIEGKRRQEKVFFSS
jgi:hypothetical protein